MLGFHQFAMDGRNGCAVSGVQCTTRRRGRGPFLSVKKRGIIITTVRPQRRQILLVSTKEYHGINLSLDSECRNQSCSNFGPMA
jgi:hypothetical protein